MIDRSWPLPASSTMSPGRAALEGGLDGGPAIGDDQEVVVAPPAGGFGAAGDRVEDRLAVLAARVLVGHDHDPGALAGDPAHQRALGRVALAGRAEDGDRVPHPATPPIGARRSSTVRSDAGLWAKSTMTPNGWPSSIRSIRPGTTGDAGEAVADGRRVEPDRLAEGDDRKGVVDVEPADEPEVDGGARPTARRRRSAGGAASSSTRVARTSAAGSVP